MSIGGHLEELRECLIKAMLWLVGGFILGLLIGNWVVDFIQTPLTSALQDFYLNQSITELDTRLRQLPGGIAYDAQKGLITNIILKERIMPRVQRIDPYELNNKFSARTAVPLPPLPSERLVSTDHFVEGKAASFCATLAEAGRQRDLRPAKRVFELLPAPAQQLVQTCAKKTELTATEAKQLAEALNGVVQRRDFIQEVYFQELLKKDDSWTTSLYGPDVVREAMAEMIKDRADLPDYELARVNRWMLTMAFPTSLSAYSRSANLMPIIEWMPIEDEPRTRIRALSAHEMFAIYVQAALISGAVIVSPMVFWHLWSFVAAGLYPHEKNYVYYYLPISIGLFWAGAALAFFFVFQPVLSFLLSFNAWMGVDPDIRISEWISFVLLLPIGFGVSFQLPLVMLFMNRVGIFSVEQYTSNWRVSILVIFVVAMILTPADPWSMVLMAVPLCFLYFGGIALCHYMPRNRNPFAEIEEL